MNLPQPENKNLPDQFVYLHHIDPTILSDLKYLTHHNFLGRPLPGYYMPCVILTEPAARALTRAQKDANAFGFTLKVYDAYRPQDAVDEFIRWAEDVEDQVMKAEFYPDINKADVFDLGYIAKRSTHSRGSTVDLTLVPLPSPHQRQWRPGDPTLDSRLPYDQRFPDNGIDLGTGFDCFDELSHPMNPNLPVHVRANRLLLRALMEKHGFRGITTEWWHFTLKDEPYPDTYFNFSLA
ncbi:M15 family metallopeptidase [Candidatus Bealeia paramacronuclearis]|uniref:D-alanyl-D-alanine dipeptidase n=1 Tax=Candidatus Bealeia paramacronuclearis TaxID=1921001 RepID=A0ABZ2C3T7_9PROT|nr:M15 family metallopeptidase [Candidatus Bealeia paramacronuclearis]